jgi:hypothetical protein
MVVSIGERRENRLSKAVGKWVSGTVIALVVTWSVLIGKTWSIECTPSGWGLGDHSQLADTSLINLSSTPLVAESKV